MKKRQEPGKSKRSRRRTPPSPPSPDKVERAAEWEAETPQALAPLECESEKLPDIDEKTKVVLLPVNPFLVHAYWGIAAHDLEELGRVFRRLGRRAQPVLRFHDVTHVNFDGTNAHSWFDVEIDLRARNWYVHLQSPGKSYCVDLGLRTDGGGFRRLARSNVAETPPASPSDEAEESYLLVDGDYPSVKTVAPLGAVGDAAKSPSEPSSVGAPHPGEEKGPGGRGASRSAPTDGKTAAPAETERILAELFRRLAWERSGLAPKAAGTGDPQPPEKARADLTELSERSFRAGISSGRKSS